MTSEERRSHVRTDMLFQVKFNVITAEEHRLIMGNKEEKVSLRAHSLPIDDPTEFLPGNGIDPSLIQFLLQMDQKMDRIMALISGEKREKDFFSHGCGVNISGSGMMAIVDHAVEVGQIIHATFFLSKYPPLYLDLFGEIVRVTPIDEKGAERYQIGIHFLDLSVNDREKIIATVFRRQRESLREQKR